MTLPGCLLSVLFAFLCLLAGLWMGGRLLVTSLTGGEGFRKIWPALGLGFALQIRRDPGLSESPGRIYLYLPL